LNQDALKFWMMVLPEPGCATVHKRSSLLYLPGRFKLFTSCDLQYFRWSRGTFAIKRVSCSSAAIALCPTGLVKTTPSTNAFGLYWSKLQMRARRLYKWFSGLSELPTKCRTL
jgi:hypothetical protein